ncbi:hypothetical protein TREMEDRAFT_57495 [Tremella mesenterica DSM 1558]|uniref:uncharacterized protein n=1 Tax=Tremella mesenterica (strain ATCC 24925 / CBS 8224 / DSM 1558 / NBRC 9311 / NRRL Y-6157 / RJB 2259-6 / UBC 559-6) TaxID=578456 RepID=UPI0003F49E07|nr:uncharacterized protein TREMEDRAFT_57495 [Tremella mesenterica DSM 1558]EIW67638.1 hypothetical protein TREMEDRAFT_57495 [Tremella mesenterica DSM 1558]
MSQRHVAAMLRRSRQFKQIRWTSSSQSANAPASGQPPTPPKPIDDSTSALDYKMHRPGRRLPHLVNTHPRNVSAEEAVTNILYNTPPPSTEPYKRHRLNCLVQNEPGVLSRVSGILAGRGFNIDSLVVCQTEIRDLSRMCIVLKGQDGVIEQARRQLEDLVPVWAVLDYTNTNCVERELLLAKVSILGPDYADLNPISHLPKSFESSIQNPTPPSFVSSSPSSSFSSTFQNVNSTEAKVQAEQALARSFESAAEQFYPSVNSGGGGGDGTTGGGHLYPSRQRGQTATEALIAKNLHFSAIKNLAMHFGGKVVDMGEDNCIVELVAKSRRIDAFLSLMRPFGVLEAARSGVMVLPRTPIPKYGEEDDIPDTPGEIDASMLPPG